VDITRHSALEKTGATINGFDLAINRYKEEVHEVVAHALLISTNGRTTTSKNAAGAYDLRKELRRRKSPVVTQIHLLF
jgi:hypothetical protein